MGATQTRAVGRVIAASSRISNDRDPRSDPRARKETVEIDSTAVHGSRETDGVDARDGLMGATFYLCVTHTAQRTAIASSSITSGAR
jgi:hypothetical protein